jgi:hypothetical protein
VGTHDRAKRDGRSERRGGRAYFSSALCIGLFALVVSCKGTGAEPEALPVLPTLPIAADSAPPENARPFAEFVVAFTAEVRGEIEPCGCPTTPYGGFARRARLLEALRAEGAPVFVLDAGDMLVKGVRTEPGPERTARAEAVLDLARATGLDAWAASPIDAQALGHDGLAQAGALAANGPEGFESARILERGGVRLGVIGLAAADERFTGPDDVVARVRAAMTVPADAWVVLSNAPDAVNQAVAEGVPGLAAVLSTRGEALDAPLATKGALRVEAPDRGRYVTVLRVAQGAAPGPWALTTAPEARRLAEARTLAVRQPDAAGRAAAARHLEELREGLARAAAGRRLVVVEERPLGSDLDSASTGGGDDAVTRGVARWRARSQGDAQARAVQAPEHAWAGTGACARCHSDRLAAWTFDPHAKAYDSLLSRNEGTNPECIGCHTTGWGQPGGFGEPTAAALRTWKAVQCEACHGPLGNHPSPQRGAREVGIGTCVTCHDAANSPQFDANTYLPRISCSQLSAQGASAEPGMPAP